MRGRGSRDGIDRAVLAARLGSVGAVLEGEVPRASGRQPNVRHPPPRGSAVESGSGGPKKDFPIAERLVKRLVAQELR